MISETIKDIRKRCRLAMNGVVSSAMREKGVNYKLNFGVSLNKIKEISQHYNPDVDLAESLWKEDVRELKILATMLYPAEIFDRKSADRWVLEIPNQEIREQVCLNLFQKLDFSEKMSMEWANLADSEIRITGYWLAVRLLLTQRDVSDVNVSSFNYLMEDVVSSDNILLHKAALLAMKHLGRMSEDTAKYLLNEIKDFQNSNDLFLKEIYDSLSFEFDYYFE